MRLMVLCCVYLTSVSALAKADEGRFRITAATEDGKLRLLMIDSNSGKIWEESCFKVPKLDVCIFSWWGLKSVEGITISSENLQRRLDDLLQKASDSQKDFK